MSTTQTAQRARILNGLDEITDDVFVISDEGPDKRGNYLLIEDRKVANPRRVRAHPTRILKINPEGSPVYRHELETRANCPECGTPAGVDVGAECAKCTEHGTYPIDWGRVESGPRPAAPEPEKKITTSKPKKPKATVERTPRAGRASTNIDFAAMKKAGELWTKVGVSFDYPGFDVKAHVFIIAGEGGARKWCFNSYNGTWGKKSKDDDMAMFIENKHGARAIGYPVKGDVEQERRKLQKAGYVKE